MRPNGGTAASKPCVPDAADAMLQLMKSTSGESDEKTGLFWALRFPFSNEHYLYPSLAYRKQISARATGSTSDQALARCLQEGCGISLPGNKTESETSLYVGPIRHLGTIAPPAERRGGRLVADDATGTPLEHVHLKRKAYQQGIILVSDVGRPQIRADGTELLELRLFGLEGARKVILETNHTDKSRLLNRCIGACGRDLGGATTGPR
jgi:hypothetical protein